MKTILTLILICLANLSYSFIKSENVPLTALPAGIRYLGQPVQAMQYEDKTGRFLVLKSKSLPEALNPDEQPQARIHMYVYKFNDANIPVNLWQLHDRLVDCTGAVANLEPEDFKVTDLDKNGKAELWLTYRLKCQSGDQPSQFKIMMLDGTARYSRRGLETADASNGLERTITSDSFNTAPAAFERHVNQLWAVKR